MFHHPVEGTRFIEPIKGQFLKKRNYTRLDNKTNPI